MSALPVATPDAERLAKPVNIRVALIFLFLGNIVIGSGVLAPAAMINAMTADLNVSTRDVLEMEGRLLSYDAPLDGSPDDDDERAAQAPIHYLEDHRYDPAVQVEEADWESSSQARLMTAIGNLDARSQAILSRRWLAEEKATLHELADEYGVSAERIRQLEKNAMDKVRAALTA